MVGKLLALVAALALTGCAGMRGPDPGEVAFNEAAMRCQLPYLTGQAATPNFREGLSLDEVSRRFTCLRGAMTSTPAIAQHRNLDAAAHMVQVAEFSSRAVANGADPLIAEGYYSQELLKVKSVIAQRAAAQQAADAAEQQRVANALAAFGSSMQQAGAQMQQNRITPFTCTRMGAFTSCQ